MKRASLTPALADAIRLIINLAATDINGIKAKGYAGVSYIELHRAILWLRQTLDGHLERLERKR